MSLFLFSVIQCVFKSYFISVFQIRSGGEAAGEAGQIYPLFAAKNFPDIMRGCFTGGVGIGGDDELNILTV